MKYNRLQYSILLQSANNILSWFYDNNVLVFQISRPRLMISEYYLKHYYIHFTLQHHVTARCQVSDHQA